MVSDFLCPGAVVCFTMAVRTKRNRIVRNVGPAVGKPTDVVNLQEGLAIRLVEWRPLAAMLATTASALKNPALDLWIATDNVDNALGARRDLNAAWRTAKRL